MATQEQKEQLIAVLKFTPRTYKIQMWGYGGEKVMGTVDRAAWDYCMENQIDLQEIAWNSDAAEDLEVDANLLPFPPGSWYECDNMAHVHGVSRDAGTLQITDEDNQTVFEKSLSDCDGCDGSPQWVCRDEIWFGMREPGEIVFVGSSNEKGTFFEGEINLTAPFDIALLELQYDDIDGEEIISSVCYAGEEIDNWGANTNGKSSDFNMVIVGEDGEWDRYEPGEKDWGTPECGVAPDIWEKSPSFKFKNHKPVHIGWYSCVCHNYGTSYSSLYWDGDNFVYFEYGKCKIAHGVDTWQGYTWDTADWSNRPAEPPQTHCTNTQCGWTGDRNGLRVDDDYEDHCPKCDSKELEWIDYDLDTKQGRDNLKKYSKIEETANEV